MCALSACVCVCAFGDRCHGADCWLLIQRTSNKLPSELLNNSSVEVSMCVHRPPSHHRRHHRCNAWISIFHRNFVCHRLANERTSATNLVPLCSGRPHHLVDATIIIIIIISSFDNIFLVWQLIKSRERRFRRFPARSARRLRDDQRPEHWAHHSQPWTHVNEINITDKSTINSIQNRNAKCPHSGQSVARTRDNANNVEKHRRRTTDDVRRVQFRAYTYIFTTCLHHSRPDQKCARKPMENAFQPALLESFGRTCRKRNWQKMISFFFVRFALLMKS